MKRFIIAFAAVLMLGFGASSAMADPWHRGGHGHHGHHGHGHRHHGYHGHGHLHYYRYAPRYYGPGYYAPAYYPPVYYGGYYRSGISYFSPGFSFSIGR